MSVNCYADTNERSEEPNEIQKTAFKRFMAEKETLMSETEKILSDFFKPDDSFNMSDVISILSIDINRDGKCGLFTVFNRQYLFDFDLDELGIEHGQEFGVSLFPEMKLLRSFDEYNTYFKSTEQ